MCGDVNISSCLVFFGHQAMSHLNVISSHICHILYVISLACHVLPSARLPHAAAHAVEPLHAGVLGLQRAADAARVRGRHRVHVHVARHRHHQQTRLNTVYIYIYKIFRKI